MRASGTVGGAGGSIASICCVDDAFSWTDSIIAAGSGDRASTGGTLLCAIGSGTRSSATSSSTIGSLRIGRTSSSTCSTIVVGGSRTRASGTISARGSLSTGGRGAGAETTGRARRSFTSSTSSTRISSITAV